MYPNADCAERLVPDNVIILDNNMQEVYPVTNMVMCLPSY